MTRRHLGSVLIIAVVAGGYAVKWNDLVARVDTESAMRVAFPRLNENPATANIAAPLAAPASAIGARKGMAAPLPMTLPGGASALLAEEVALQLLAKDTDITLSAEQWSAYAAVALNLQAIRQAYEASIARVTIIARGRYRLEIPAYPDAGDALRVRFYTELREKLGGPTADNVVARMGSSLEGYFAGFGISVQTLDFTADPGRAGADYQVTRTVTFWNSVDAGNRLTTRRETHFPGLEDPTGHAWGPFLSLFAAHVREKAGT